MSDNDAATDIQGSFNETLERTQLPDVALDVAELSIDNIISNPLLKELPLVKTFAALLQTGINIHDRLFLKKILSFLNGIDKFDSTERERVIKNIDESKKYRLKVGEKLLYVIDKCNDYESSELVAKLFAAFLRDTISYDDYLIASEAISANSADDIQWFIENYSNSISVDELYVPLHTGLFMIGTEPVQVSIEEESDYKALLEGARPMEAAVTGGGVWAEPSHAGQIIYKVLYEESDSKRTASS